MGNGSPQRTSTAPISVPRPRRERVRHSPQFAHALNALLDFSITAPVEAGTRAVCRSALDCCQSLLPAVAIGLRIATQGGLKSFTERKWPDGAPRGPEEPNRLFPEMEHERVIALGAPLQGSSLHVASDSDGIIAEDSLERAVIDRAAQVIGPVVARAYANTHDEDASQHIADLRAQLVQAQKLATLGQTVAGVVHELSNPLTSILGHAQMVEAARSAEERARRLQMIADSADRMLRLCRGVVAYSRPAEHAMSSVDMREVATTATALISHTLKDSAVSLVTNLDAPAHNVIGRQGPLTQVLVNLLSNAVHAMNGSSGTVEVRSSVTSDGQRLVVEVADTGSGIAPEHLGRIFDAFFTTKEKGHGTGLGLAIVRDIIEHHGGTIRAVSRLGEGTTFTLALPLAQGRISLDAVIG